MLRLKEVCRLIEYNNVGVQRVEFYTHGFTYVCTRGNGTLMFLGRASRPMRDTHKGGPPYLGMKSLHYSHRASAYMIAGREDQYLDFASK